MDRTRQENTKALKAKTRTGPGFATCTSYRARPNTQFEKEAKWPGRQRAGHSHPLTSRRKMHKKGYASGYVDSLLHVSKDLEAPHPGHHHAPHHHRHHHHPREHAHHHVGVVHAHHHRV